ncbi:hypothetical protein FsymDg_1966 [Candidatus Protofrankia datiscae]|uniref:Uncharacterized protein n=1 Tax=Candidatus Protofrankia datiscae TaxID=2716812 RepID=F8B4B2_9ACTN|nr:hypothetical protein FsymDg_1966 [Candidatus Protofrankia datiscae]
MNSTIRFYADESALGVGRKPEAGRRDVVYPGHKFVPEFPLPKKAARFVAGVRPQARFLGQAPWALVVAKPPKAKPVKASTADNVTGWALRATGHVADHGSRWAAHACEE